MYSKEEQLKHNKVKKQSTFGKKRSRVKPRSDKMKKVKLESNPYNSFLHNSGQVCCVCGCPDIVVHHPTDLKRLKGLPRRDWKRAITLCNKHHDNYSKVSIHVMSHEEFYEKVMSFETIMFHCDRLYKEYLRSM